MRLRSDIPLGFKAPLISCNVLPSIHTARINRADSASWNSVPKLKHRHVTISLRGFEKTRDDAKEKGIVVV